MKATYLGKLKKENGKLVHLQPGGAQLYDQWKDQLPEGAVVDYYVEVVTDDGSLAQLAKIHAMIRELSNHTGFTFEETKLLVKKRSGLVLIRKIEGKEDVNVKSLGDCDKDELSSVIQALIELGHQVNCPLQ